MPLPVFDISDSAFQSDPIPILSQMRAAGPVVNVKMPIVGTIPALTDYQAIDVFLREHKRFARDGRKAGKRFAAGIMWWMPGIVRTLANNMMSVDEPEHRRLRHLVELAFARRNVDAMHPEITRIADSILDQCEIIARRDGQVDFLANFARQFPLAVICELLGLPDVDRSKFTRWFEGFSRFRSAWSLFKLAPGVIQSRRYLKNQIQQCREEHRRGEVRPGLIADLVATEHEGDALTDDELLGMIFLLLVAGHETTTHLIAGGLLTLMDHPTELERLVSDWSLAETAVDEILRYAAPVQITKPRFVTEDTELAGYPLKRGSLLIAMLACGNLDPVQFPEPERFDLSRTPNRHLSFGRGIHFCLGFKLAKAEFAVAIERLLTRFPDTCLAVPRASIRWRARIGVRSLEALPLRLTRS